MKPLVLIALLMLGRGAPSGAQHIGNCPPAKLRKIEVRALNGVVSDPLIGVIPKLRVTLQELRDGDFRDAGSTFTNATGKFDFGDKKVGIYRLVFLARGFCRLTIEAKLSKTGWAGFRLTLPIEKTDTCPGDCGSEARIDEIAK